MAGARETRRISGWAAVQDACFARIRRREARHALGRIGRDLRRGARVLDLGCGRGYLGALLEREYGCRVIGCDVARRNEALARFCLFDGRHLPFRSAAFGAAVLAFVLHHAEDPLALLRVVARVTAGPLLVLEDTPRVWLDRVWGMIHCRRFNRSHGLRGHGRVRSEQEWRSLFTAAGLRVVRADPIRRRERFPPVARTLFVLRAHPPRDPPGR